MTETRLRVLLVPDSVHWVTGTIAKSIARFNPWMEATIASGPVIDQLFAAQPELMRNFDLVHFTCPYASREWLPRFREIAPCVTSHHHVTEWEAVKHNVNGDAIIVGSPEWSADLSARGADTEKVFWVPYGVDADKFKPTTTTERDAIRSKLGISPDTRVVGFSGKNSSNDDDRKGIDVFTAAAIELNHKLPKLAVLIVGPGWNKLVDSLTSAGVKCIWFPYIEELDGLIDMYRALDFYWVTARVEGGPVPLLEAMSSEVCSLTTRVGLAREVARDGENAVVLPFNDAGAFVNATLVLAADANERARLGRNARQTMLAEMHVGVVAKRVASVYEKAFANFAERRPGLTSTRFRAANVESIKAETELAEIPLNGLPRSIHKRVQMLEALAWSEHLVLYHRQRALALKMIAREWLRNPTSTLPARVFLRRFLPTSLVAQVVKVKQRSAGAVTNERAPLAP